MKTIAIIISLLMATGATTGCSSSSNDMEQNNNNNTEITESTEGTENGRKPDITDAETLKSDEKFTELSEELQDILNENFKDTGIECRFTKDITGWKEISGGERYGYYISFKVLDLAMVDKGYMVMGSQEAMSILEEKGIVPDMVKTAISCEDFFTDYGYDISQPGNMLSILDADGSDIAIIYGMDYHEYYN